jgi:serine/threonine protein kinase
MEPVKIRQMGEGDFATIYLGKWQGGDVAIKVIDPRKKANAGRNLESDFQSEVKALKAIDHPNCLKLLTTGRLTIVTDIAAGVPLSDVLYKQMRKLPEPRAFAQKLAAAVAHLHSCTPPIVHRDLKPENIIVDLASVSLKLIDFGMAQCVGAPRISNTFDGSPLYGAPEALSGAPPSLASEVWSLACVVVEMHSAGRPFSKQGIRNLQDLQQKARAGVPPWSQLPPIARPDLIQRAFSLTPSHRPAAAEIASAQK